MPIFSPLQVAMCAAMSHVSCVLPCALTCAAGWYGIDDDHIAGIDDVGYLLPGKL